jgi:hypothetical protein
LDSIINSEFKGPTDCGPTKEVGTGSQELEDYPSPMRSDIKAMDDSATINSYNGNILLLESSKGNESNCGSVVLLVE